MKRCALLAAILIASGTNAAGMKPDAQRALLDNYCQGCHNYSDFAGGLELEEFDPANPHAQAPVAEKMLRKVRAGMMPPAGEPRPATVELVRFADQLEKSIDAKSKGNFTMPKLHRLNRNEYANAVRDLLGLELDSTTFLPPDDSSRGFDNQASALTVSPALLEAYLSAAARVSRLAMGSSTAPIQVTYRIPEDTTQNYQVPGLPFGTRGGTAIDHVFPADGQYLIKVFAVNLGNMGNFRPFGEVNGEQLLVYVDGARVAAVDWDKAFAIVRDPEEDFGGSRLRTIDVPLKLSAGTHRIGVTFLATQLAPGLDMNRAFARSTIETGGLPGFTFYPHIGSVRIDGPEHGLAATDSPVRRRILSCHPNSVLTERACAQSIASRLAHLAYRGRETPALLGRLMEFYDDARTKGTFDDGVEALLQRLLADPLFVYRLEATPATATPDTPWKISGLELASRLSFFLWSSIPDEHLLALGASGALLKDGALRTEVRRMLADSRASALTRNFAGQWLALRNLEAHAPVVDQFPDFDDNLRRSMRRETELLFQSILEENRSVVDLLTADYTFVDERLARHYGIPGIRGSDFQRVRLEGDMASRRGLLGKGSVLTITSQPGRTSPVIRGNWVLKTLLGVPAPDPPPNVPVLEAKTTDAAGNVRAPSMREQLSEHRNNPACRGCHKLMDPIGFALEPFDAIGRQRQDDGGLPIDASDTQYDGLPIDGPDGVRTFLLRYQDQYLRNVAQNLLTYALGRGVEYDDMPAVRSIVHAASSGGYRLRDMIEIIATSQMFRMNAVAAGAPSAMLAQSAGEHP